MRIALVTQEEPFYLPPALDMICSNRKADIVALIVLPSFNEKLIETAKRLYRFYGWWDFIRLGFCYLWAKIANQINLVRPIFRSYSALETARRHGIPVHAVDRINSEKFLGILSGQIKPDLIVSIAASQIFKSKILQIPRLGCINLHSAPLPRYQGMMPNFWAMVNGEKETAVSVHYMVEKIDAGEILVQEPVPIQDDDSLHDLMVRSKQIGGRAVLKTIGQIENETIQPKAMDSTQATYFSFPTGEDAKRLRRLGRRLM